MGSEASIILKDRAMAKVREYFAREGLEGSMLRISLVRTHCMQGRGHSYHFAPERTASERDEIQDWQGLPIVLRKDQTALLKGTVIDNVEGLEGSGFSVSNPQATGKCPCGRHDLFD